MKSMVKNKFRLWSALIASVIVLLLVAFFYLRNKSIGENCTSEVRSLYPAPLEHSGYYIDVREDMCSDFGASDVVSVILRRKNRNLFGGEVTIFKYDPSSFGSPLDVVWIDSHHLKISVNRVEFIQEQMPEVDGILVEYQIGSVGGVFGKVNP